MCVKIIFSSIISAIAVSSCFITVSQASPGVSSSICYPTITGYCCADEDGHTICY